MEPGAQRSDRAVLDSPADVVDELLIPRLDDLLDDWSWQALSDVEQGLPSVESVWRTVGGLISC